jgi:Tol biopolymer transport system component
MVIAMRAAQRLGAGFLVVVLAGTVAPAQAPADDRPERNDRPDALIAFTRFSFQDESFALFRARPGGSDRRRMTSSPAFFPDWSPNRRRLVFDFTDADGNQAIGMVRRDGSGFRQLTDVPGISEVARFSPDGRTLVFDRSSTFPDQDPDFSTSLWLMDVDGRHQRPLFEPDPDKFDVEPEFSPDGGRIVFARIRRLASGQEESAVFVVRANGRGERQLTRFEPGLEHPRWAPTGRGIIFNVEKPDPADPAGGIFTVRANGAGLRALLRGTSSLVGFKPDYSPDGRHVLFGCFVISQEQDDLCVMRSDGTRVRNITRTPRVAENYPVWD